MKAQTVPRVSSLEDLEPVVKRAKPLFGTLASVAVRGLSAERVHTTIAAAFAELGTIHRLMSFHEYASDVSRLNREAHRTSIEVNPRTYDVLAHAINFSAESAGIFDITVAPLLVAAGILPRPLDAPAPDPLSCWRDVELLPNYRVRFWRPLWIDLGGIAKGYAVDRSVEILERSGCCAASVNAGGDLRVVGAYAERVHLRPDMGDSADGPLVELEDASLASSCSPPVDAYHSAMSLHIDPVSRKAACPGKFVSVVAPRCIVADALTKIVMVEGDKAGEILRAANATAVIYDAQNGWRALT